MAAAQLSVLTQSLLAAQRKEDSAPLTPQRVAQLIWLGLSPQVLQQLAPHITVLPERTALNLNTATLPALYASVPGLSWADAQRLVQRRERQYWRSVEAFEHGLLEERLLDEPPQLHLALPAQAHAVARTGGELQVAVCDKAWLHAALAPLHAAGLTVQRIVPECAPSAPPCCT